MNEYDIRGVSSYSLGFSGSFVSAWLVNAGWDFKLSFLGGFLPESRFFEFDLAGCLRV